jgi:DNA end-binding protein Ku
MAVAHKGSISMGMVLIPVGLYKTTVDNDIHFNQLEKESKARIKYKKYCSHCGKEVAAKDIIKGYEYEKDKYVVMTDDELERIKTKKDKTIHILQFAKMSEVNMIYYEKDYYAIPEAGAEKAYELLRQALLAEKKVAIAKTVMGTNEKLLVLYPLKDGMIVKTLFYNDEIAAVPKQVPKMKLGDQELEMARMLIQNMTQPFDAEQYQDEYQARLRDAIMKKIQGQEIVTVDSSAPDNVIDLMEALKKSLEQTKGGSKGKKAGTA